MERNRSVLITYISSYYFCVKQTMPSSKRKLEETMRSLADSAILYIILCKVRDRSIFELMKAKVTIMLIVANNIMAFSLKMTFHGCITRMLNMVGCARFARNIRTMQVLQKVLFHFALVSIQDIQHTRLSNISVRHQRLEKKLYKSENELKEALQRAGLSLVEKAKVNILYIIKCIHTIHHLIRKNIAVNANYADLIRFDDIFYT